MPKWDQEKVSGARWAKVGTPRQTKKEPEARNIKRGSLIVHTTGTKRAFLLMGCRSFTVRIATTERTAVISAEILTAQPKPIVLKR